ncbi:hypothetical protein GUJ93_ZPchr0002g24073 [Zizania palustris]|nr:hypothetical protein GUJ93_ZPchr0002g24073 [Zizania palustris]
MLLKYRPEDKAAKKERLLKRAQAEAEGKTVEAKKPIVVKYGLNHVTYLIEQSKAQLVVIAHDVDPIELVVWLPALCRKMEVPYCIVKGKARLGSIVHKKTASVLCLTTVKNEDKLEFSKILEAIKANFNDKFDEVRKKWGGGVMGSKSQAKTKAREKLIAKEAAQRINSGKETDREDPSRTMEERSLRLGYLLLLVLWMLPFLRPTVAIRFVIDREECFSHNVDYEGDTVHVSFVVIKAETPWHYTEDGVDLVVKDPSGNQIHDSRDKTSDKFEFIVHKRGVHRFCFTNKSPYHETVDFDVLVGHFSYFDQHAKDEHFGALFEQIAKLDEALYNIQFEQHWLEAQTDRQAILNENMGRRAVHKALFESAALIAASVVQIYLLRRLFERKLGTSRV